MNTSAIDIQQICKIFPFLGNEESRAQLYLESLMTTLDKKEILQSDLFYLPLMLAHEDTLLAEKAQIDWIYFDLQQLGPMNTKLEHGILQVPVDLRFARLTSDYPYWSLTAGVWAFRHLSSEVRTYELNIQHGRILDLLSEDRKFTERQLLDQLVFVEDQEVNLEALANYKKALEELIENQLVLKGV